MNRSQNTSLQSLPPVQSVTENWHFPSNSETRIGLSASHKVYNWHWRYKPIPSYYKFRISSSSNFYHRLLLLSFVWTVNVLQQINRMLCTTKCTNRTSDKPLTMWINKIFCGKWVPMFLCLERWRVEILTDDVHMQLAVNKIFNTYCVLNKSKTFCKTVVHQRFSQTYTTHSVSR